jgi:hypothetical protein
MGSISVGGAGSVKHFIVSLVKKVLNGKLCEKIRSEIGQGGKGVHKHRSEMIRQASIYECIRRVSHCVGLGLDVLLQQLMHSEKITYQGESKGSNRVCSSVP